MPTVFLLFDVNLLHFSGPFALTVCYARLTSSLSDVWQWKARWAVRSVGGRRGLAGRRLRYSCKPCKACRLVVEARPRLGEWDSNIVAPVDTGWSATTSSQETLKVCLAMVR